MRLVPSLRRYLLSGARYLANFRTACSLAICYRMKELDKDLEKTLRVALRIQKKMFGGHIEIR